MPLSAEAKHKAKLAVAILVPLLSVAGVAAPAHADDTDLRLTIPKPTVGVAASVGQTFTAGDRDAQTITLEGRLAFGCVELAGELAKSEYDDQQRNDRRLGGSIYVHLSNGNLRPLVSAGAGLLRADHMGGVVWDMAYGQVGAGLLRRLNDQVDLSVEATMGRRLMLRSSGYELLPLTLYRYIPDHEDYGQVQLKLIIRL